MSETQNQFSLTRAASITGRRVRKPNYHLAACAPQASKPGRWEYKVVEVENANRALDRKSGSFGPGNDKVGKLQAGMSMWQSGKPELAGLGRDGWGLVSAVPQIVVRGR